MSLAIHFCHAPFASHREHHCASLPHCPLSARCRAERLRFRDPPQHSLSSYSMSRPGVVAQAAAAAPAVPAPPAAPANGLEGLELETSPCGMERLRYRSSGWQFWQWQDAESGTHRIHYISAGVDNRSKGPTVLLIHGFGASAYHWRHNIPALVNAGHRVFAVDLLGFGMSDKATVSYDDYSVWRRQLGAFIRDVVKDKAVLVGNSLGGYNSLSAAATYPDLVSGVVLLNGAGRFDDLDESATQQRQDVVELDAVEAPGQPVQQPPSPPLMPPQPSLFERVSAVPKQLAARVGLYVAFLYAKQPGRIKEVLNKVYINPINVDDDLVTSILEPAQDVRAAECFRLILTGSGTSINGLLRRMRAPLLLLWGDKDPWIGPRSADRVMQLYPEASRIRLDAGHCPHDEAPAETNEGLLCWLATLDKDAKL